MQLSARDRHSQRIYAYHAVRGVDYYCPECQGRLRVRAGRQIRAHFFHLTSKENCRQQGKSEEHLFLQNSICRALGPSAAMEVRFDEIGRIADVFCQERRLVVEVQCSPISDEEIRSRTEAYESLGYSVIWILHDKTFKKKRLTSAEEYLQKRTHYYTSQGIIYDECHVVISRFRKMASLCKQVDIAALNPVEPAVAISNAMRQRKENWKYSARGDLLSSLSDHDVIASLQRLADYEKRHAKKQKPSILTFGLNSLRSLWHFLLEQSCK